MAPPGGGRNPVTARLLRHFNQLAINEFADSTCQLVYTTIFDWWATGSRQPSDIAGKGAKVVSATIAVYSAIRAELLPTPAKGHYTFNMRDLSKVLQGMQMVDTPIASVPGAPSHRRFQLSHNFGAQEVDRTCSARVRESFRCRPGTVMGA